MLCFERKGLIASLLWGRGSSSVTPRRSICLLPASVPKPLYSVPCVTVPGGPHLQRTSRHGLSWWVIPELLGDCVRTHLLLLVWLSGPCLASIRYRGNPQLHQTKMNEEWGGGMKRERGKEGGKNNVSLLPLLLKPLKCQPSTFIYFFVFRGFFEGDPLLVTQTRDTCLPAPRLNPLFSVLSAMESGAWSLLAKDKLPFPHIWVLPGTFKHTQLAAVDLSHPHCSAEEPPPPCSCLSPSLCRRPPSPQPFLAYGTHYSTLCLHKICWVFASHVNESTWHLLEE